MGKPKAAHHRGTYHVRARHVRQMAYANPDTRCWRCGLTLAQHKPGDRWTAGHVNDGEVGGMLLPETASCNYRAGQALARHKNQDTSEQW